MPEVLVAGSNACGTFVATAVFDRPASSKSASLATPIAGRGLRAGLVATCGSEAGEVAASGAGVCFGATAATVDSFEGVGFAVLFVATVLGARTASFAAACNVAKAAGAVAATTGAAFDVVVVAVVMATGALAVAASFGVAVGASLIAAGFTVSGPPFGASKVVDGEIAAIAAAAGAAATAGCDDGAETVATGAVGAAGFGMAAGASGQTAAAVCVAG